MNKQQQKHRLRTNCSQTNCGETMKMALNTHTIRAKGNPASGKHQAPTYQKTRVGEWTLLWRRGPQRLSAPV